MSALALAFPLQHIEFISLTGPDARSFLQGQVTCDVELLTDTNFLRGAICNIKGRVVADFELVATIDGCLMAVTKGLGEQVKTSLAKYAVFSKVVIALEGDAVRAFGLMGTDALAEATKITGVSSDGLTKDFAAAASANGKAWVIHKPGTTTCLEIWSRDAQALDAQESMSQSALWQEQELRAGVARITPATTAHYTAQDLNYDLSAIVSFSKGCYTGQEIVARMHYRGKAKKRLTLLEVSAQRCHAELPDQIIDGGSGKRLDDGIIATSGDFQQRDRALVLAILPCNISESIDTARVSNSPDAKLRVIALPYDEAN